MVRKIVKNYMSVIFEGEELFIYEQDVASFEIEVGLRGVGAIEVVGKESVPAIKKGFIYVGEKNITIKDLLIGIEYSFRTRAVRTDGSYTKWSKWAYETIGDLTIGLTFSNRNVSNSSSASTFTVDAANIPTDFDSIEWYLVEQSAVIEDDPDSPPDEPTFPTIPYLVTNNPNEIELVLSKNRETWFHVGVKAVDNSGNKTDLYYIGCGKLKVIDVTIDQDRYPPNFTEMVTPDFTGADELNFI